MGIVRMNGLKYFFHLFVFLWSYPVKDMQVTEI